MSDRAAQLRTLATSFYRELMRLADEMDAKPVPHCSIMGDVTSAWNSACTDVACPVHGSNPIRLSAMDPALDC